MPKRCLSDGPTTISGRTDTKTFPMPEHADGVDGRVDSAAEEEEKDGRLPGGGGGGGGAALTVPTIP